MGNKENKSELIIYRAEDGKIKIDVRFQNETVWLKLGGASGFSRFMSGAIEV